MGRKIKFAGYISALYLLLQFFSLPVQAQGDLLINPRRIVFEGNRQRQEITLANTGRDTATYSISFIQYHMTEDGSFEIITEPFPGQLFADPYLRFFPRRVTLAPKESQIIRMQMRRLPDMKEGEYRSHIYFRAVPDEKPLETEGALSDSSSIGIRLTPIYGITIPVIIRIGLLSARISIEDIHLTSDAKETSLLHMTFRRDGEKSVYGDIAVDYEQTNGERVSLGMVRGVAVYTPNTHRKFSMPLDVPEKTDLSGGKLLIRYSSSNDTRSEVYCEKKWILP